MLYCMRHILFVTKLRQNRLENNMPEIKKIGVLTGGGDCSGLNAVVRAVTLTAINKYG